MKFVISAELAVKRNKLKTIGDSRGDNNSISRVTVMVREICRKYSNLLINWQT